MVGGVPPAHQSADWEQFDFQPRDERRKVLEALKKEKKAKEPNKVTALGDKGDSYKFDIETMSCCQVGSDALRMEGMRSSSGSSAKKSRRDGSGTSFSPA